MAIAAILPTAPASEGGARRTRTPLPRLFCFAHAGGTVRLFRGWQQGLRHALELSPVQLPGRGRRWAEGPFERLEPLLAHLYRELRPQLGDPFAIFGHSLGGLVGFELARWVRRRLGVEPVHLFVSAFPAPQLPPAAARRERLSRLADAELVARIRALGGVPEKLFERPRALRQVLPRLLPTLRADLAVVESYAYARERPLACPITVFGGLRDPVVSLEQLEAWREQTRARLTLELFGGGHFFLETQRRRVTGVIAAALRGAGHEDESAREDPPARSASVA